MSHILASYAFISGHAWAFDITLPAWTLLLLLTPLSLAALIVFLFLRWRRRGRHT